MNVQLSLVFYFVLLGTAAAINYNFMDCAGNEGTFGILRRCCHSDQLPNGCECFDISSKSDFSNTFYHKPECPSSQEDVFWIYTRSNKDMGEVIRAGKKNIEETSFGSGKKTFFVAHGFTDLGTAPWMLDMKDALLNEGDFNVILVDWQDWAKAPNYYQAAANTRIVGAMIEFPSYWTQSWCSDYGKEIQRLTNENVGRITGLDPAGPAFESYTANVRLDKSDATFVDVIHTDGETLLSSGFGTRYSLGDVDFYPNGGRHQPSCPEETFGILSMMSFEEEKENGACSHGRAVDYFTNSIAKCHHNLCTMGYHVDRHCKGDHYPKTEPSNPYCCTADN